MGNNESIRHVHSLLYDTELGMFFTPESRYSKTRSKYGNKSISTLVVPLKPAKYLTGGIIFSRFLLIYLNSHYTVNMDEVREAKRRIDDKKLELTAVGEELVTLEAGEQEINLKINNARKERDNANNEKKKADTIIKKLGS